MRGSGLITQRLLCHADCVTFLPRNAMQARPMPSCGVCLSVCFSRSYILSKRISSKSPSGSHAILVFLCRTPWQYSDGNPLMRASNAGGVGRNRDSEPIFGLTACVNAATAQVLSTRSPVDHGHHLASYDTSLVVSGGVDCGRRRRNAYDQKPQRYAKENRTAHLVTNL